MRLVDKKLIITSGVAQSLYPAPHSGGLGLDSDKMILEGSFVELHRALVSSEEMENTQVQILSSAIKDAIKQEILQDIKSQEIRGWSGGVAGI
jgi:hypothetical protein